MLIIRPDDIKMVGKDPEIVPFTVLDSEGNELTAYLDHTRGNTIIVELGEKK